MLGRQLPWVVIGALVVLTVALFIPTTWGEYLIGVAAIVASWPLAYQMWQDIAEQPETEARPSPA